MTHCEMGCGHGQSRQNGKEKEAFKKNLISGRSGNKYELESSGRKERPMRGGEVGEKGVRNNRKEGQSLARCSSFHLAVLK